ncbi:MAG TPA: chorismate mutase [Terriglobales bacterium]|nr:chorismate mutase [Terriglobales bacterium]
MDISDWRKKIDDVDRRMAALLNERAAAVIEIGKLKAIAHMPIYEPNREKDVIANVQQSSTGPLGDRDLAKIYERLLDVMRSIQGNEISPNPHTSGRETEIDSRVED